VVDRRAALLALMLGSLGCSDARYDLAVGPDIATVVVVGVGGEQPRAWAFPASEGARRRRGPLQAARGRLSQDLGRA
jgi:hypothetical protein